MNEKLISEIVAELATTVAELAMRLAALEARMSQMEFAEKVKNAPQASPYVFWGDFPTSRTDALKHPHC